MLIVHIVECTHETDAGVLFTMIVSTVTAIKSQYLFTVTSNS